MAFLQMGFSLWKAKGQLKLGQKVDLYLIEWVYKLLINRGYEFYNQVSHGELKQLLQDALKLRY
ncbi:MAG: hypothetical protein EOO99_00610 [Pedobacter sp.]|nr:MAG: hypothetical protein EOO99_00610 [Pedobacter sp.]